MRMSKRDFLLGPPGTMWLQQSLQKPHSPAAPRPASAVPAGYIQTSVVS